VYLGTLPDKESEQPKLDRLSIECEEYGTPLRLVGRQKYNFKTIGNLRKQKQTSWMVWIIQTFSLLHVVKQKQHKNLIQVKHL